MTDDKPVRAFSQPLIGPLYDAPPFVYQDVRAMHVNFRTDPAVLEALVPAPLVADPEGAMSVTFSRFFCSGFGSYHEMLLAGQATWAGRAVNYCVFLVLDNDIAICGGREIWGFPKKLGRVTLGDADGIVRGEVERGGLRILTAAMQVGPPATPEDLGVGAEYVNLKLIPSVTAGAAPEVHQLTSTTLSDIDMRSMVKGDASLEFGVSPADPLHRIPVDDVLGGVYYHAGFTLGDGVVLHDYLAP